VELYLHSPNKPAWCDARLKHKVNFTFTFNPPKQNSVEMKRADGRTDATATSSVHFMYALWKERIKVNYIGLCVLTD